MTTLTSAKAKPSVIYWICRAVFLESIRRREISAVFLFMGLFIIGAIAARFVGSETEAAGSFVLNLGISLAWILSLIISILLAARQFPDELEQRSIYPLLAKPVARYQYLLGKWVAVTIAGSATALVLNLLAMTASPWPDSLSLGLMLQGLVLEILAIAAATAIAIALSIRIPKAMTIVITGLLVFAGTPLITMVQSLAASSSWRAVVKWLAGYIPSFGKLDLANAFTAGMSALAVGDFTARAAYAVVVTAFFLGMSMILFERKQL